MITNIYLHVYEGTLDSFFLCNQSVRLAGGSLSQSVSHFTLGRHCVVAPTGKFPERRKRWWKIGGLTRTPWTWRGLGGKGMPLIVINFWLWRAHLRRKGESSAQILWHIWRDFDGGQFCCALIQSFGAGDMDMFTGRFGAGIIRTLLPHHECHSWCSLGNTRTRAVAVNTRRNDDNQGALVLGWLVLWWDEIRCTEKCGNLELITGAILRGICS